MGITYIELKVANPAGQPKKAIKEWFLVDSGAVYSIVPKKTLLRLGLKPHSVKQFTLANGEVIKREVGNALFLYKGNQGASPVIFGELGDSALLGVVTLEALGFIFDPIRRQLKPMPMLLCE